MTASLTLHPHPTTSCPAVRTITVALEAMADGGIVLRYRIVGDIGQLRIPAPRPPGPADGLWQHTCCEAFVGGDGDRYREFNFSPSGQWAAYDFAGYRQRNADYAAAEPPAIEFACDADSRSLTVRLPATLLPGTGQRVIGLTAVIETADGSKSYWALAHAGPQPDFHLRQSFTLALNRPTP
mgnify:CR=1 FL=1